MPTRRSFVQTVATATLAVPVLAEADTRSIAAKMKSPALPDVSFSLREPFVHRERAAAIMKAEGLDALVVGGGRNVFYATNFFPLLERMSFAATALAVIPRDPRRPVGLVIPSFSYYYIQADEGLVPGVQPFVFTSPVGYRDSPRGDGEPPSADPLMYRIHDARNLSERERHRRAATDAAAPYTANMERALAVALRELGITSGRIGHDDPSIPALLARALPAASAVAAEDTLRRVRLVRTAPEIRMMRIAAQNNVDAALATMRVARELGTLRTVRQRFYSEAALRGNNGVFMVVNAVSSEAYDEPLKDGQSFMIDCVSHCRNFHGDFGRTVFMGEPPKRIRSCTDTMSKVWAELQARMRPGMRFSQIRELGQTTLAALGSDVPMIFNPHSVGLAHNDQPRLAADGSAQDHVLEENMILSIDCVLAEVGGGGTAHLEDLVLITPTGTQPIHTTGSNTYIV